jgi:hypothetical protein
MPSTKRIDIRLSEEDKKAIEEKAKRYSMTVSDYMKFVALNANIKVDVRKHNYKIGDTFKNACTNEIYKVISVDDNVIVGENKKEKRAFGEHLTYGFEDLVDVEGEQK